MNVNVALSVLVLTSLLLYARSFVQSSSRLSIGIQKNGVRSDSSQTSVNMADLFGDLRNFFGGENNDRDAKQRKTSSLPMEGDENLPAGTYRVATIPGQSTKLGGLRLFVMFYFMGMQKTPDRRSWQANQPSTEEYVVDLYYQDNTAVLSIELEDEEISILRVGSSPSTAYLMQEAIIVQGLLDELHQCAFDDSVEEENRLLILREPKDAIEKARDALAFG
jgi:hypothetical protein